MEPKPKKKWPVWKGQGEYYRKVRAREYKIRAHVRKAVEGGQKLRDIEK